MQNLSCVYLWTEHQSWQVMPCILLWATCIYCSIVFLHNVMYGPQCLASACKKTFRDTGVHFMPLAQKIERACSKTMATEPTATFQCKNPKTGSALMMNHGECLHCNILGQRLAAFQSQGSPNHGSLYLIALLSILILSWHTHLDLPIGL